MLEGERRRSRSGYGLTRSYASSPASVGLPASVARRGEVSELAEGARLEIAYSPTRRVAGSNPALSASDSSYEQLTALPLLTLKQCTEVDVYDGRPVAGCLTFSM